MDSAITPNISDNHWMALALRLAERGLGMAAPNPAVGCIIVKNSRIIGRGYTQNGGRPHAESVALQQAGAEAKGATAYVSLEPCAHHGQTPPCAAALVSAGITRVVSACEDPDSRVAGRGHAMIKDAGVAVSVGVLEREARALNAGFFLATQQNRPLITLKLATSFDGRIATGTGESKWITSPPARAAVQTLRSTHDAIMIGSGTAIKDDPDLRARLGGVPRSRVRMVLDSRLRVGIDSRLMKTADDAPVWLYHANECDISKDMQGSPARLIGVDMDADGLSLPDILADAAGQGITRILCEGGGQLAASLLRQNLVDSLITFHAGLAIGAEGTPALAGLGLERLDDAPRFALESVQPIGADIMTRWMVIKN